MKIQNYIFIEIITILCLLLQQNFTFLRLKNKNLYKKECFPMLWNQGITKKSWVYLEQDESKFYQRNSDITEGDDLNMPTNSWNAIYNDNETQKLFRTPNQTNASFKFVTTGYNVNDQKKDVGFDFMVINKNKKKEEPYIFRISNNSQYEKSETLGIIKEVGFVFENWPQYWDRENKWTGGMHSFRRNYEVEQLDNLIVKFKFRLVKFSAPLHKQLIKEKWLGSYATCDLRFNSYNDKGEIVNKYLIGVIFSNPLNVDYNENQNDNILYGTGEVEKGKQQILLLHGNKNGVTEVNKTTGKNVFQSVEIDFKPLIDKYLKIDKRYKNIITGLDIYSGTRATNFIYEIQDIRIIGCEKN